MNRPEPDDRERIAQARAGDFDAFEALLTRHERRAYSIARNIVRQREDAEDVVQTAFLKAFEHLDGFREEASFATWIARITVNTALKVLRKRRGLRITSLDAVGGDGGGRIRHPQYIARWRDEPERIFERRRLRAILDEGIEALPQNQRVVFVLRDLEGLSVRDTAQALGISEGNVKVRLLRARLALRERLTRIFGDESTRVEPDHSHGEGEDSTDAAALLRSYEKTTPGRAEP